MNKERKPRPPVAHILKTHPPEFQAVALLHKTLELRDSSDRDFRVGDVLSLREYLPDLGQYSGQIVHALVTHIVPGGKWGLPDNLCALSIKVVPHVVPINMEFYAPEKKQ